MPQNFYESVTGRTIDVIKYPPNCPVDFTIKSDLTFGRNFIEKKVFQFATRYIYDDDGKSTVSPYSLNSYNNKSCSSNTSETQSNYIEVDLSVLPELNETSSLQTIKKVEIFVKEGELGTWKSVKVLEQSDFVDVSNQKFDFYNNGIYSAVDQERFVDPYSSVPLQTKNQEVVKNRLFYGNNLEGFDNVCVDANIDISYKDSEQDNKQETHSVSGQIFIRSPFNGNNNKVSQHQAIYGSPDLALLGQRIWGGVSDSDHVTDLVDKTNQQIPLGGFLVYLAGTEHKGISTQNISLLNTDLDSEVNYIDKVRDVINNT